jgi:hypothetical protein
MKLLFPPATAALVAVCLSADVWAQPVTLPLDAAGSTVQIELCLNTPLGAPCDTDTSPLSGGLEVILNDFEQPTQITLVRYSFTATETLNYQFGFGFAGSVTGSAQGVTLRSPESTGPIAAAVDQTTGAFTFDNVPGEGAGSIAVTTSGLIAGFVPAQSVDLATLVVQPFQATGTVTIENDEIVVTFLVPFVGTADLGGGITVDVDGLASGVARAPVPVLCPADVNRDGQVSPTDFSAWVAAFNTQAPACDQNGDNICTPTDFSAWVANFNAGCP